MSLLNSPGKLGLLSHPSSFGADTASKYSFFGERKGGNLGDAMNLSEIKFSYVSGETYSLINRDLKLHNDSKVHYIGFQIQCNNPHHYKVFPSAGQIPPGKIIEISIQILGVQEINEMRRNFFAKFASDRFKIIWWTSKESDRRFQDSMSKVGRRINYKILTVSVDYNEEPELDRQLRKNPAEQEKKIEHSLEIHKQELERLQRLIQEKQAQRISDAWIYPKLTLLLCLLAFLAALYVPF